MRQPHRNVQHSIRSASHTIIQRPPTSSCTFESACRPRQHACFDALDKVTEQVESSTSSTRGCTSGGSSSLAMRSLPSGSFDRDVVLEPQRRQHANSWTKSATLHFLTVHATMCPPVSLPLPYMYDTYPPYLYQRQIQAVSTVSGQRYSNTVCIVSHCIWTGG